MDAGDYVVPVDKPEGPTSHDVVARARRALGTRRIGHTGTLDPFASGLLVLCVGRTTRLSEYLTGLDKTYVADAVLGVETDTLDLDGTVVGRDEGWRDLDEDVVREALGELTGVLQQVPPQFSAKKVGGEAMHRKARRGESVDLDPVTVTVHDMELESMELPHVRFAVRCSSGTYVRALARDLGRSLGVGAHLTGLRRTRVGALDVERAVSLEGLDDPDLVEGARLTPMEAVEHMRRVDVDADAATRIRHGQRVRVGGATSGAARVTAGETLAGRSAEDADATELVAVALDDDLVAMAVLDDGVLRPRKVFPE